MTNLPLDRLVRKETALGVIREYEPPKDHIGLSVAPFREVGSDDVIFDYVRQDTVGMAPARAEDAESELAGKDESVGTGRASIIDWAIKDHYDPSDVTRYREGLMIGELVGSANLPLTYTGVDDFRRRVARDDLRRRRRLDNRIEWLIISMLDKGEIVYDDGNIAFTVKGNRPTAQQDVALPSGNLWGTANADPIGDLVDIVEGAAPEVNYGRVVMSRKAFRSLWKSDKFVNAFGQSRWYAEAGWSVERAAEFVQNQVGLEFVIYDSVYSTRPLGSNAVTHNRFMREDYALFLPTAETVAQYDDSIGFAATLTSPHPEGNWTPGFYEWEKDTGPDPWGIDRGSGIKAFPVFPHLNLTAVYKVI